MAESSPALKQDLGEQSTDGADPEGQGGGHHYRHRDRDFSFRSKHTDRLERWCYRK